ncbi:hypothetical protein [Phenylobacterium sp.]|jgi:uncharacterized integral membrane protein|uniref:hypothetical protein n=1 Tax=Phenylobacterium sp. TaxID=1871053 RepID=UPI000C8A830B|nr:hypothetical protein [Phenylobacterium sp.]MAK82999.1 hypothetical protein [Phenylobacterium sp.]|tara:strand:- start:1022 stop:1483 length:462 start_codon:yes stop_codon:yes gene_type:complete
MFRTIAYYLGKALIVLGALMYVGPLVGGFASPGDVGGGWAELMIVAGLLTIVVGVVIGGPIANVRRRRMKSKSREYLFERAYPPFFLTPIHENALPIILIGILVVWIPTIVPMAYYFWRPGDLSAFLIFLGAPVTITLFVMFSMFVIKSTKWK